jgi:hypothetical protein
MNVVVNSSDMWNIVSEFLDMGEVIELKKVNRSSGQIKIDYLSRIRNNQYNTIPVSIAKYYCPYFLKNREYNNFFKIIPYMGTDTLSFKIFRHMALSDAIDVYYAICKYDIMKKKNSWKYPYFICQECFGYNFEVFKYFIHLNQLRGLDYLAYDFKIIDEDDIIFIEYLENHILN